MTPRFSQRIRILIFYIFFAALFFAGIALLAVTPDWLVIHAKASRNPPQSLPPPNRSDFDSEAVRVVTSAEELHAAIAAGRRVLFVNCDWNPEIFAFRRPFSDFADWAEANASFKTISVKLDADEQGKLWNVVQAIWKANGISPGGLKTFGGAGRVVWFEDGRVVDYAWCMEVSEIGDLRARTVRAFR